MRADSDSGGEAIIICIDHTTPKKEYYDAQLEAVRSYATYIIESHPRTVVGLLTMTFAPFDLRFVLRPTRDLNKIFDSFRHIERDLTFGAFDILEALTYSLFMLTSYEIPKGVQKRIVMFAGGDITMTVEAAAKPLKMKGVIVDVVNFTLGDEFELRKEKLEAFVAAVNDDDKTHIIHVKEGSSLSNLLSSFMPGDAHVEAKGMMNKDHQVIYSKKAMQNEISSFMDNGTKNTNQLIHSKKAIKNENSSFMAKGVKNKNQTTRLSSQKKATENENVSSKGAVGHEHVKNAPSKLHNRLKHSRSLSQVWFTCLIVCFLALLMCAA